MKKEEARLGVIDAIRSCDPKNCVHQEKGQIIPLAFIHVGIFKLGGGVSPLG